MRKLIGIFAILVSTAASANFPTTIGGLRFGMTASEVSAIVGEDVTFEGQCVSCSRNVQEQNLGPAQFRRLAVAFPGITPDMRAPNISVTLISTHGKLSGIVLEAEQNSEALRALLQRQLGKPTSVKSGTGVWRMRNVVIRADFEYGTIAVFDRHTHPHE